MAKQVLLEQVTKGGRIALQHGALNDAKLIAADQILEGVRKNDALAIAEFKNHMGARFGESLTTGDDFIFAFAQLSAFQVQTEWEQAERTWTEVIPTETVTSFEAPKTYTIEPSQIEGFARPVNEPGKPDHVVPVIPEGSPYPRFVFKGETSSAGRIQKAGGSFGMTFEQIINDVAGIVPVIPRLINESLLDREEYDAWYGLIKFIDIPANHLQADETLDGSTNVADAPLSRAAIAAALKQARLREIDGKRVQVRSYDLLVPVGETETANWYLSTLNLAGLEDQDGSTNRIYNLNGYNPLQGIRAVVETEYLTGSQWALVPSKGAVRGSKKFYSLGTLVGHIGPELRVENATGTYLGGGAVPPFEGSYATDEASFRGRIIEGGLGWNPEYAVFSDGDGS